MTKLKLNKLKDYKVYILIVAFFSVIWKAVKYGENKEKFKQCNKNEKVKKKRQNIKRITSFKQLINKLRKHKF